MAYRNVQVVPVAGVRQLDDRDPFEAAHEEEQIRSTLREPPNHYDPEPEFTVSEFTVSEEELRRARDLSDQEAATLAHKLEDFIERSINDAVRRPRRAGGGVIH